MMDARLRKNEWNMELKAGFVACQTFDVSKEQMQQIRHYFQLVFGGGPSFVSLPH